MTSAPVHIAGPAEDTRRTHDQSKDALRAAVGRTAELLRRVDDAAAPVPGLTWTAAETAAHMAGELRDYTLALTRHTAGYMTHANRPLESPSRMGAVVNARQLTEIPDRNISRLADVLEESALAYLAAATAADESAAIPTANGLVLSPSTMTSLLLGEQVVHGLDIARAARVGWEIDPADALMIIPGVLTVAPAVSSAVRCRCAGELRAPHSRRATPTGWRSTTEPPSSRLRARRRTA